MIINLNAYTTIVAVPRKCCGRGGSKPCGRCPSRNEPVSLPYNLFANNLNWSNLVKCMAHQGWSTSVHVSDYEAWEAEGRYPRYTFHWHWKIRHSRRLDCDQLREQGGQGRECRLLCVVVGGGPNDVQLYVGPPHLRFRGNHLLPTLAEHIETWPLVFVLHAASYHNGNDNCSLAPLPLRLDFWVRVLDFAQPVRWRAQCRWLLPADHILRKNWTWANLVAFGCTHGVHWILLLGLHATYRVWRLLEVEPPVRRWPVRRKSHLGRVAIRKLMYSCAHISQSPLWLHQNLLHACNYF